MEISGSLESLWTYIQSLSLTDKNREWLAGKLLDSVSGENEITKEELLSDFERSCKEIRLYKEGKIKLKTIDEALDEIRN